MGGKKKVQPCGYQRPHPQHVHDGKFCKGMPMPKTGPHHRHAWEVGFPVMRRNDGVVAGLGEPGSPWQGPFECQCGQSAWLVDGRHARTIRREDRFPIADPMTRIMALKAKVDSGQELDEVDKAELEALADALIEAFKPMVEALRKLAEQAAEYIVAFLDKIDWVKMAELVEVSKAYGEKPDAVETVTLMGDGMEPIEVVVSGGESVPATAHVATQIASDEDHVFIHGQHSSAKVVPDVTVHADGSLTGNTPLGRAMANPDYIFDGDRNVIGHVNRGGR